MVVVGEFNMRLRKWKSTLLAVVLIFIMAIPVQASSTSEAISDAQEKQNQTKEELNSAQQQVNDLGAAKAELETYLTDLSNQLTELNNNLSDIEAQAQGKEEELAQTQEELHGAREIEAKQYEDMKKRIQFMYEKSDSDYIALLLGAESFSDFLNKAENISQISQYDREMLAEYQETKDLIAKKETQIESEQQEILELQAKTEEKQQEIATLFASTSDEISGYVSQIASAESEVSSYESALVSQQSILDDLLVKLEEEELALQVAQEQARQEAEAAVRAQEEAAALAAAQQANTTANQVASTGSSNTNTPTESAPSTNYESAGAGNNTSSNTTNGDTTASNVATDEVTLLAALIQCEAGGESYEGQVAVGAVVLNRVNSSSFPNTISGVIYQSGQFSPVASGRLLVVLSQGPSASCISAAQAALAGSNPIGSCLFFKVADGTSGTILGNHVFY